MAFSPFFTDIEERTPRSPPPQSRRQYSDWVWGTDSKIQFTSVFATTEDTPHVRWTGTEDSTLPAGSDRLSGGLDSSRTGDRFSDGRRNGVRRLALFLASDAASAFLIVMSSLQSSCTFRSTIRIGVTSRFVSFVECVALLSLMPACSHIISLHLWSPCHRRSSSPPPQVIRFQLCSTVPPHVREDRSSDVNVKTDPRTLT